MKFEPYKLKAEIVVMPNGRGTGINARLVYVCDPDKNKTLQRRVASTAGDVWR